MAEALGVASAGVGIAAFALQIAGRITELRAAHKYNRTQAGVEIENLIGRLESLQRNVRFAQLFERHQAVELAITNCWSEYANIDLALQRLLGNVPNKRLGKTNALRSAKLVFSREIRQDIQEIRSKIDSANIDLIPSLLLQHMSGMSAHSSLEQPAGNSFPVPNTETGDQQAVVPFARKAPQFRRASCNTKHCHCSCHRTEHTSGRHWGLEYTSLSAILGSCDNKLCSSRRARWNVRVAFTPYGVPWAVFAGLEFLYGAGKYTIRPSLGLQRVVKYTSPGFEILWKCQYHAISLSEAQERFLSLKRTDPSLKQHVNPSGNSYVRELVTHGPWGNQSDQFELLMFLAREFEMTLENEDQSFLIRCAKWIGEGRHIDLLVAILENGFDPVDIDSPLFAKWPSSCSPNWRSEELAPDPFFIEYLSILEMNCPGFVGTTALDAAILTKSFEDVKSLLSSNKMSPNRNFLGQTPLHLAASDMRISSLLVDAGHDLNATDRRGITPLMYAAAMGISDVVQLLLSKGANPFICDADWNRDFFAYASVRGHWKLIFESLETIRACHGHKETGDLRKTYFESLVDLFEDVNFTFSDYRTCTENNNLLHYVQHRQEAHALVRRGFHSFNQPNSQGELAIFSIARHPRAELIRFCLDNGTEANHVNNKGCTFLIELLAQLSDFSLSVWDIVDSVKLCLIGDIDIFLPDTCRCACSSAGCRASSVFDLGFDSERFLNAPELVWAFEWLCLVEEFRGYQASKRVLLSFLQRMQFDLLDIKHVCCHKGRGISARRSFNFNRNEISEKDIDDILDEESEFIKILGNEMRQWSSSSLETLKSQWMILLKRLYDECSAEAERKMEEQKSRQCRQSFERGVDYKDDNYYTISRWQPLVLFPSHQLVRSMANYAFWLQHEVVRSRNTLSQKPFKEGWYERRLSWFADLMNVMQIQQDAIFEAMREIYITESSSEQVDQKAVIERFSSSLSAWISRNID